MIRNMYLCLQARRGLILVCLINYMLHVSLTNEISLHIEPFQRKNPQRFYTFCKLNIYQSKKKLKKHIIVSLFGPELTYNELPAPALLLFLISEAAKIISKLQQLVSSLMLRVLIKEGIMQHSGKPALVQMSLCKVLHYISNSILQSLPIVLEMLLQINQAAN